MHKISAIVFDMDGVLIDAKEWHYDALNRALELFGYSISRLDHLTTFDGLPTRRKLELLTLERGLPEALHEFLNELKQLYTVEQAHLKCKPMFVHEYALSRLQSDGYRLAVASNSVRGSVELMMRKSNLIQYMDFLISNEDVQHPKPHPEMYTKATELLDVEPRNCLVVEDNPNGVQAAESANCPVLVVEDVREVNYEKICNAIERLEGGSK